MPDEPADTMRERSPRSTAWAYVLFDADRKLVAVGLLLGVFVGLVLLAVALPDPVGSIRSGDPVETAFQSFIGATITGVTLVLTLNQLVLSQELGAVGDQRERMEGALSFREDAADALGDPVSPAEPFVFLRALVMLSADRARAVRDAIESPGDDLEALLDSTEENTEQVASELENATFGEFDVLSAALLSLVVTVAALAFLDVAKLSGGFLGVPTSVLVVSGVVAVAPFVVLLAYVLRIATVTGRTLSIGPFILRQTDRSTDE